MWRFISEQLHPVLLGRALILSMERNKTARDRLDAAIRDLLAR